MKSTAICIIAMFCLYVILFLGLIAINAYHETKEEDKCVIIHSPELEGKYVLKLCEV